MFKSTWGWVIMSKLKFLGELSVWKINTNKENVTIKWSESKSRDVAKYGVTHTQNLCSPLNQSSEHTHSEL